LFYVFISYTFLFVSYKCVVAHFTTNLLHVRIVIYVTNRLVLNRVFIQNMCFNSCLRL